MSYILDALTKSQQQRRQMDVPGLDTPQIVAPARRAGGVSLWNGALVVLAGAAIAYAFHTHFDNAVRSAADAPSPVAGEPGAARTPVPASAAGGAAATDDRVQGPSGGREGAATGADGTSRQAHAAPRHQPTPAKDAGARPPRPAAGATPAPPPPRASIASPSRPGDVPARERGAPATDIPAGGTAAEEHTDSVPSQPRVSPATEDLVRDLSRLVQRVPPEPSPSPSPPPTLTTATPVSPPPAPPASVPAAAQQPPALSELPWDVRAGLGALEVNAHLYSDVPAERLVVINMRRYREGEQISSGPRIDAITPRGAILSHASGRFRIDVR